MYGLNAVKTLGVRIGTNLNEKLCQTAQLLSKTRFRPMSKSEIARKILEDFFDDKKDFRTQYELANAKEPYDRKTVKQSGGRKNVKQSRKIRKKR